jgi:hypothetical protein
MNKEDIKPGMLVLWKGPTWNFNPLQRRVTEVREDCVYFEKGLPNGQATCPFTDVTKLETEFKYLEYPISKQ